MRGQLADDTIRVRLPEGAAVVDLYWPDKPATSSLVIVAHGFFRRRHNMSAWGQYLAKEGFVAAVPDLPARADHTRNGRFISALRTYLCDGESWRQRIDPRRVGLMGFSAGGLACLLAAADNPGVAIWVGLDPVDSNRLGVQAALRVNCHAFVLMAEPSACNAHGNARNIVAALPNCEHYRVAKAVHVDAEWPTDWMAEVICGRSENERRSEFHRLASAALREALIS